MDLMHALLHEIGHLLGNGHAEEGLMAPVLSAGWRTGSSSAEAVEPLGQAEWRTPLDNRRASDDVFAQLGRDDLAQYGSADGMSQWLESEDGDLGRTAIATSPSRETPQLRLPRRSRVQRYEREADDWFAQLAEEDGKEV